MKTIGTSTLISAAPQLPASDIAGTIEFYRDKLGFSLSAEYPGFAILKRDSVEVHLWQCENKIVAENSSCYVRVQGVDNLYAEVTERGATVQEHLAVRPWGMRQFSILDPSGNAIRFGEPVDR